MSAKERFLKKLQDSQPRGPYDNKAQADIAEFQQKMSQLHETMEGWLDGTGIRTESTSVSLVEFLIGGRAFSVPGIHLRHENKMVKFTPVFLYGQGVTGCVETSLCADATVTPLCRLFMRAGENTHWTWRPAGMSTDPGSAFGEDIFFGLIEGLLA
ncbi:hypothetical protein RHD99_09060 [Buttiauxella selenatireducens]|uniref:Uncharacterized protein n=1 Tax=Buttiauxella selenatireducens TaxID=3073902 RepID=A0ABY9SEY8_9ENTR|nr:hypothetical protein [Buttiauxella sp. R73]WMY76064.1 hypothetical protein RHD99_09060 [Buttiauxella sp. R73]